MRVASTRKIVGLITARNEDPGLNARNTFTNDLKHSSDDSINNQQIRVKQRNILTNQRKLECVSSGQCVCCVVYDSFLCVCVVDEDCLIRSIDPYHRIVQREVVF